MGTKNNPGRFDCHDKAEPDEPMFVLLGRDPDAAALVDLWAILRHRRNPDDPKIAEALVCAKEMWGWCLSVGREPSCPEEVFFAATKGMAQHPDDFDQPCECDTCLSYD